MQEGILSTIITKSVMHADCAPAFWTPVLFVLCLEKCLHAVFLEKFQVLDRARGIIPPVTSIDFVQSLARKLGAFKAKGDLLADLGRTLFLDERAILVPYAATGAILHTFLLGDVARIGQISGTKSAVNATRPNQILIDVYHSGFIPSLGI